MRNSKRILWSLVLLLLTQFPAFTQDINEKQYLQSIGIVDSLYSESLDEVREVYIQFPFNYNPEENKKYPVVYILDGEVFLATVNNVQNFYSGGFTPEMILVGISNADNRTRDLTTSKITEKYGMPYTNENGEAEIFEKFIEAELIPFIESKYPVSQFRTLIGHSLGGLFSIYMLMNHAHVFSNYLAIDPSLDWDNQKLLLEAKDKLTKHSYKGKSLFISLSGQLHMQNPEVSIDNVMQDTTDFTLFARSNIAFSNAVKLNSKNGLIYDWKFYPKDLHGTVPFPSIMDGLISIFEWYQMENTDRINSFDTSIDELLSIIKCRENKLKDHFGYLEPPYPEDVLNVLGYMNMDMDQLDKSKMYFEKAIEYYPKSANAYDSMSDFYERNGDNVNAIKYAGKAFELNQSDYYKKKIEALKKK